jgi:hypothetical protein
MASTFDDVKAVIMDVLKIDGSGIKMETRFIEDLKADSMDQFFLIDGFCDLIRPYLTRMHAPSNLLRMLLNISIHIKNKY